MLTLSFDSLYAIKLASVKGECISVNPSEPKHYITSIRIMNDVVSVITDVFVGRSSKYGATVDK